MKYGLDTKCIHLEEPFLENNLYGSVSFPIFQTSTFAHPGVGQSTGYDYSRADNPTREQLEHIVDQLEGGSGTIAFASGMSAVSALMELFKPGDHIIAEINLYGGTTRLFEQISEKNGIRFSMIDLGSEDIEPALTKDTKAVFLECPTNPTLKIIDIRKIAESCKQHGILLIVDNTFMSPYFMNPLELGADIVIHSGTKYLGGHNDTLAGFLTANTAELADKLRYISKVTGAVLPPLESWLIIRGIQTLGVRMERAQSNAMAIAKWLLDQPHVTRVLYPGLETHPGHDIMIGQSRGFGAIVSFETDTAQNARSILERVRIIRFAESLGGTETLVTYPITQTHGEVKPEILERVGISDRMLRLSVGLENVDDLINDLENAMVPWGRG